MFTPLCILLIFQSADPRFRHSPALNAPARSQSCITALLLTIPSIQPLLHLPNPRMALLQHEVCILAMPLQGLSLQGLSLLSFDPDIRLDVFIILANGTTDFDKRQSIAFKIIRHIRPLPSRKGCI